MRREVFDHERLAVYQKALHFIPVSTRHVALWPKTWAVTDHFSRATESIPVNVAEAASQRSSDSKSASVDCALGSALECAACLDIAGILGFLSPDESRMAKRQLAEIVRMLVGLHKSWKREVREGESGYQCQSHSESAGILFFHENLEVYQVALDFVRWVHPRCEVSDALAGYRRHIDTAMTSMVLNIAEGNGRFSATDHRRFLGISERAAVKTAAYLDMAVVKNGFDGSLAAEGKRLLIRVVSMLAKMMTSVAYA
jgi:four helix bundle protein